MTDRTTIEAGKRSGQPCVRGLRVTVWMFSVGLLQGWPRKRSWTIILSWSQRTFARVYEFAARVGRRVAQWSCCFTRISRANSFRGLVNCILIPRMSRIQPTAAIGS